MNPTNTAGRNSLLGATVARDGVNFTLYSLNASKVELLLIAGAEDTRPSSVFGIDPTTSRASRYRHILRRGHNLPRGGWLLFSLDWRIQSHSDSIRGTISVGKRVGA